MCCIKHMKFEKQHVSKKIKQIVYFVHEILNKNDDRKTTQECIHDCMQMSEELFYERVQCPNPIPVDRGGLH